ncbi:hypothetical protein BDW_09525 [Bdellovibrio bacteriovorus W]|nr:hypothetical protein BDW_09525 [Bdellovibrio bacteriovorus W]
MKCLAILFSILISSPVFANQIVLDRQFHSGTRLVDILKKENEHYFLQGKDLGTSLPKDVLAAWKNLENYKPKKTTKNCPAGDYKITKKNGKKTTAIKGCVQGKEYVALMKNLRTIRKYSETVK